MNEALRLLEDQNPVTDAIPKWLEDTRIRMVEADWCEPGGAWLIPSSWVPPRPKYDVRALLGMDPTPWIVRDDRRPRQSVRWPLFADYPPDAVLVMQDEEWRAPWSS